MHYFSTRRSISGIWSWSHPDPIYFPASSIFASCSYQIEFNQYELTSLKLIAGFAQTVCGDEMACHT
jgi:hypothetical protein